MTIGSAGVGRRGRRRSTIGAKRGACYVRTWLVQELSAWAREQGWEVIEATAYADLPIVYAYFGRAGMRFWGRLVF